MFPSSPKVFLCCFSLSSCVYLNKYFTVQSLHLYFEAFFKSKKGKKLMLMVNCRFVCTNVKQMEFQDKTFFLEDTLLELIRSGDHKVDTILIGLFYAGQSNCNSFKSFQELNSTAHCPLCDNLIYAN